VILKIKFKNIMNFDDFDLEERARKLSHREPFHQGGVPLPRNLIRYTAPDDLEFSQLQSSVSSHAPAHGSVDA
jgi:hypothetical protein